MTITRRPWGRALLWLALLGPFFFASYGFATWLATQRAHVPAIVFDWERAIPLWPWTIVPYWSIDILYGISLALCVTRAELDTHAKRLLTAQVVAVTCFIVAPLRFTFERPPLDGVFGALFALLGEFDKPFNQAPSLHIALLVILWVVYARHVPRWSLPLLHAWFALIGISVLTTWQHHVIDVPTGAWLGFFALWLWPDGAAMRFARSRDPKRQRLALRYAAAGLALAGIALWRGGIALWLLWPAASLLMVALGYAAIGPGLFQKDAAGRLSLAARWLLGPYLVGAAINTRLWKGDGRPFAALCDGVSVGRWPRRADAAGFATIIDLSAELPGRAGTAGYVTVPMLDLATPEPGALRRAARAIEQAREAGPVLVCCALGYSRSAAAAATWLLMAGRAAKPDAAVADLRRARPHLVLDAAALDAVAAAAVEPAAAAPHAPATAIIQPAVVQRKPPAAATAPGHTAPRDPAASTTLDPAAAAPRDGAAAASIPPPAATLDPVDPVATAPTNPAAAALGSNATTALNPPAATRPA